MAAYFNSTVLEHQNDQRIPRLQYCTMYIKVCNGNYGETFWRGINKLLENDAIYASAARINEFYFGRGDEAQRQHYVP